jgi:hypothetical protein
MPSKPVVKKETNPTTKETARPARKAAPRVSTAKHRAAKSTETSLSAEMNVHTNVDTNLHNNQEIIAAIAYGYWEARGCQGGDPMEDWVRAEAEFNSRTATAPKTAVAVV